MNKKKKGKGVDETPTVGMFRAFFYHDGLAISQKRIRNFAFRF